VIARTDRFRRDGASLRELLAAFLQMPAVRRRAAGATIAAEAAWQLPFTADRASQRAFDGALLVGDAGGFVDSLTGEGIHNAVLSATIAAGVVCEALARGDTTHASLSAYDERWREVIEPGLRRARRFHRRVAAVPPVLETLFVLANAGRPVVRSLLNRMSTDFVIHA
jgi:flavin-dependent dehydrogenase